MLSDSKAAPNVKAEHAAFPTAKIYTFVIVPSSNFSTFFFLMID